MLKKSILVILIGMVSTSLIADESDFKNNYVLAGFTFSDSVGENIQGINLEYDWIDYKQHMPTNSHKHKLTGFGIKLNTDETKFENKYSDVRELGVYGKKGFELKEESDIYGLLSLGVGLVETSNPKNGNQSVKTKTQEISNEEGKKVGEATTGNPNTDENISLSAEFGAGVGYYSREGNYAASLEILGQYYEVGDFDPALRVMFGWRF